MKWTRGTNGSFHNFLCSGRWLLLVSSEDFFQSCPLPVPIIQTQLNVLKLLLSVRCKAKCWTFTVQDGVGEGIKDQELLDP